MARRVLFDTTRLAWRSRRGAPTGIDRVIAAYGEWLAARDDIELVCVALAGDKLVRAPKAVLQTPRPAQSEAPGSALQALTAALRPSSTVAGLRLGRPAQAHSDWAPLGLDMAKRALKRWSTSPPSGDVYVNVAHTGLHRDGLLPGLRQRGVRPVVLLHDLIPITHPEFCTPAACPKHHRRVSNALAHADLIISNSQFTADELADYATAKGMAQPNTVVAHLGLDRVFTAPAAEPMPLAPYFVFVGTIEARKNIAFLLSVWRRLSEALGAGAPHLVLVGRRGWENESVIDQLERSPPLRRVVHEVCDLSDADLARLVAGARALIAPSLVEGFDLPPVEARALGTPVLASDIAAHREVAHGARLIDPLDGPGWIEAIEDACRGPGDRTPRPAPNWAGHFAAVTPHLDALLSAP